MSSTNESKNIKSSKRMATKKASVDAYKMLFGDNTYPEQCRREYHPQVPVYKSNQRTVGFEALGDKDGLAKRLVKTKICHNLEKFGKCTRDVCTFAHTPEELNDPECVFGKSCHKSNCYFKHNYETRDEYRNRRGIKFPEINTEVDGEIQYSDLVSCVLSEEKTVGKKYMQKSTPPPPPPPSPCALESETVLRVPQELVEDAIKLAIFQGKTTIRVEIVV
jgi:hypothetical protein